MCDVTWQCYSFSGGEDFRPSIKFEELPKICVHVQSYRPLTKCVYGAFLKYDQCSATPPVAMIELQFQFFIDVDAFVLRIEKVSGNHMNSLDQCRGG